MVSSTARETDLMLLGVVPWPLLPFGDLDHPTLWRIEAIAEWLHWGFVVSLLFLVPIHIAGALKHHFVDRDGLMSRMGFSR